MLIQISGLDVARSRVARQVPNSKRFYFRARLAATQKLLSGCYDGISSTTRSCRIRIYYPALLTRLHRGPLAERIHGAWRKWTEHTKRRVAYLCELFACASVAITCLLRLMMRIPQMISTMYSVISTELEPTDLSL